MKMVSRLHTLCAVLVIYSLPAKSKEFTKSAKDRTGKLFSVFQIVTFPNDICLGGTKNGTCYTAAECTAKGGVNAGSCAQGYGVCCTFTLSCGGTSNQNCTYIDSATPTAGACRNTICPSGNNICQLRLDFISFIIADPSISSLTETGILNGGIVKSATKSIANSFASRCLIDTFSVTNTGGTDPPVICGRNNLQHMYADVDRANNNGCNDLVFQLGSATVTNRVWSIKVTQYACDSPILAPPGCTQYFLDPTGTVQTYNFDGVQHLAFQRQTICVRRAKGQCRICWVATAADDFAVSGTLAVGAAAIVGKGLITSTICCGLGTAAGKNKAGYDCLQIPGALKAGGVKVSTAMLPFSRICGRNVGLVTKPGVVASNAAIAMQAICSTVVPFYVRFISDGTEVTANEIAVPNKGFRLAYSQNAINCV